MGFVSDLMGDNLGKNSTLPTPVMESKWKKECARDLELFCKHYFPDAFTSEFCDFHKDIFQTIQTAVLDEPNEEHDIARAAPRGHGKSQLISFAAPLWVALYHYKENILIVSDTGDQVEQFIADIKTNLEENELLLADFGNLATEKKKWRQREIVLDNNVHIVGRSAGQSLRGIKWYSNRPDFIVIDDLENDESVETEGQRNKLYNWFMKVLLKCGNTTPVFIYIGTILSYDSLLYKVIHDVKFAMWNRKLYKAVYTFSKSDLWNTWESIFSNLSLGNKAKEQAYAFYKKNREAMLEGTKALWEAKEPDYYYHLMQSKFVDEEAFNSEFQNDPLTDDMRTFQTAWLNANLYTTLPEITEVYYAVDLSMGKSRHADTSAIIGVGKGVDNYLYVLEADIKHKRPPDVVIDDLEWHIAKYYSKLKCFAIETVAFLEFVADTMKERLMKKGFYVPWEEITKGNKDMRIKTLVPLIKHGYIKFHESQTELLRQLRNYPKDNDDGVDALQMAISKIKTANESNFCYTSVGYRRR